MKRRPKASHCRRVLSIAMLFLLSLSSFSLRAIDAQPGITDLSGVNVAIYKGIGVMPSSRNALNRMFGWMNATVANMTASQIKNGSLSDFDILVVPGGSESTANSELDSDGKQMIKDFVAQGGSYFGICGGATFGAQYLRFFRGQMAVVSEPGSIMHMTPMHIDRNCSGPDLSGCPENISVMYYNSQYFIPTPGYDIHTIASYDHNDRPGMIALKDNNGTVFLSSPHAEYEEDDDRDDTNFADDFEDPESEWDLLFQVSKWLIEASYVEPTDSTTTSDLSDFDLSLTIAATVCCAVVGLVGVILYKTKYK
ncbi:MAG: hypothetical protein JW779_05355 [Candidatus Thorarchaeota archaeon]|nr:hypothetical protein [Candidatus Thorarchaeota archaeon]